MNGFPGEPNGTDGEGFDTAGEGEIGLTEAKREP